MIAKSDLIILALSTTFLVAGVVRWQHNTSSVPVVTIPASSQGLGVNVASNQDRTFDPVVTRLPARADGQPDSGLEGRTSGTVVASNSSGTLPAPIEPDAEPDSQAATATTTESTSPVSDPSPELLGTYTVVSGDYLGWIAEEFGTTVATLIELNGLDGNEIRIGQKIKYPLPN